MQHRQRPRCALHVLADLQRAAHVGAHGQVGAGAAQVGGFEAAQLGGFHGLHQVVDAGAAAAHPRFSGLQQLQVRDLAQQCPGLFAQPLAVQHVAGIVIREPQRSLGAGSAAIAEAQWLQPLAHRLAQAHPLQEFLYVCHPAAESAAARGPGRIAGQQAAVGLERVAAAGGRHQHRIERFGARRLARADHGVEGVDQGPGQGVGLGFLALVVGHGAAAALGRWDHHLDAVGAQHLHRRPVHGRLEQTLHATQHQPHAVAPLALRRDHQLQRITERLLRQWRQQPLHRRQPGPEQAGEAAAPGQPLQRCAGVEPQRLQHGPQPLRVGEQLEQQPAEGPLAAAAKLRGVELRAGGLDQFVVADTGRTGAHAGEAAQAGIEVAGHGGIQLQLTGVDRLEHVDAPPW